MFELIKLILVAAAKFFGWKEKDRMLDAGNAEQKAKDSDAKLKSITKAQAARDKARDAAGPAASTDQLPDDGFRRD